MNIVAPEEVGFSANRLSHIGAWMQRYVDQNKLAGLIAMVARCGKVVYFERSGMMDVEAATPMQFDAIFRIYSMTKPITCVALMMLYEHGLFQLTDPVTKFLPEFRKVKVWVNEGELAEPTREITIHNLLTHTAGLSYGEYEDTHSPVDKLYDQADLFNEDITLQKMVRRITDLPLVHQPGRAWRYGVATDVVGYLVEVISGTPFDVFLEEKIFKPLGLEDTGFYAPEEKHDRLTTVYGPAEDGGIKPLDAAVTGDFSKPPRLLSGGHGLVSTAPDYARFCQMLLNGGELDGARLLGRKTVELMTINHLPDELIPIRMGSDIMHGYGFGLGFRVLVDIAQSGTLGSEGVFRWAGWASTTFFIDPKEELIALLLSQFIPVGTEHYPLGEEFQTLVYQALVD